MRFKWLLALARCAAISKNMNKVKIFFQYFIGTLDMNDLLLNENCILKWWCEYQDLLNKVSHDVSLLITYEHFQIQTPPSQPPQTTKILQIIISQNIEGLKFGFGFLSNFVQLLYIMHGCSTTPFILLDIKCEKSTLFSSFTSFL